VKTTGQQGRMAPVFFDNAREMKLRKNFTSETGYFVLEVLFMLGCLSLVMVAGHFWL